jgi:hypothetical protein
MRASSQTRLLATSLAVVIAVPCFAGLRDAAAQSAGLTPYPACTTKPTPQDSEAAHSAYNLGKRFFEESDYGSASHNFIDAFKLDCTKPELLLNIARANELLGNRAEAVHALETYLQRSTSMAADDKVQLQRRIDNLKAAIAAQIAAAAPPTPTVIAPPPTATAAPTALPPPVLPPPVEERHHTALPWIVTGVGAAAGISGLVVYFVGRGDINKANNECGGSASSCTAKGATATDARNKVNTGDSLETAGSVMGYAGLGIAAAGILWHFLEPTGPASASAVPDAPKTSFVPVFGPGLAGASVVGRF